MNYSTQLEAAKLGIITKEMEIVAREEGIEIQELISNIRKGSVVIPCNKNHKNIHPYGIGKGMSTKINVNLGISKDCSNIDMEMKKVRKAIEMKAEAIMDLSCYGETKTFRKKLIEKSPSMIGTVPMYDALGFHNKELHELTLENLLEVIEAHAEDGVDFMTIHAGVTKKSLDTLKKFPRTLNLVSRGGTLIFAWMNYNNAENPLYEYYDKILDICYKHDVTVSLGDACRPGCIDDATDHIQIEELMVLGELVKRAREKNVQVIVEGPGHIPINEIETNVLLEKKFCFDAPFYVLGPIVTDIAPGYDHITSAIGGAMASSYGADFLCYVTPAEHLRLPNLDDMIEGIIATKIAAHAGDLAKGIKKAKEWDSKMGQARKTLDWETQFNLSINPEKARKYRNESKPQHNDTCTMCGKMCAIRNMNKTLEGKKVDIIQE
ncbi:phosphomethylpyrimidine synthase ThiC [Hathewaya histolytica]|uniref:Phosphomethylpyrimidine synthase n=1 Tax=Hathewaya histolytica TaxID=1498 RepID=A0A4U9RCG5_HATHI|nr:phosphomethylpyrimidine synthase ThiC [Hathewaya histolytica]VTQ89404.1 thiamine biosynthesis protein ThiC [Hathewaya histolytica]